MAPDAELSEREIEILRLVATGVSNKEIAHRLTISPNTVKVHLRNVFGKIGAASRTEAALIAVRMGLINTAAPPAGSEDAVEAAIVPPLTPQPGGAMQVTAPLTPATRRMPFGWVGWLVLALALVGLVVLGMALAGGGPFAAPATATPPPTPPPAASINLTRWSEGSALPQGRSSMAAVVFEGALYLFGGETAQGVSAAALRYRPSPGSWEPLADKPTAVKDAQAVVLGERIFVPGGLSAAGRPLDALEVFSPRLNRWETLSPLPVALSGYALTAYEGRLYLFGGWDGKIYTALVYSYDPATNDWTVHAPLPHGRAFAAAAAFESKIYVIGGSDGDSALRDQWVYFPERDRAGETPWEQRAPLPDGRYAMGCTLLANMIYLVGGVNDASTPAALPPLVYQPLNDRWSAFDVPPQAVGRSPALLALDTRLHVIGGQTGAGFQPNQLTYQALYTIAIPAVQQ